MSEIRAGRFYQHPGAGVLLRGEIPTRDFWRHPRGVLTRGLGSLDAVRASADPVHVGPYAADVVTALRHDPPLGTAAERQFVLRFQQAYGQGLGADGSYGPQTRLAISAITDTPIDHLPMTARELAAFDASQDASLRADMGLPPRTDQTPPTIIRRGTTIGPELDPRPSNVGSGGGSGWPILIGAAVAALTVGGLVGFTVATGTGKR
jgi:hypothetical protein